MSLMAKVELSPNSRFSIHDNPNVAPGVCCVCKHPGGDGRKFIDFGFQLDFYGAVYFCTYCFTEASQAFGFVSLEKHVELQNTHTVLLLANHNLEASFEEFKNASRTLLRNCRCGDILGDVVGNSADGKGNVSSGSKTKSHDRKSDETGGS